MLSLNGDEVKHYQYASIEPFTVDNVINHYQSTSREPFTVDNVINTYPCFYYVAHDTYYPVAVLWEIGMEK